MVGNGIAWERMGQLYALPGIMPQCIALQESARVSVTALLTLVLVAAERMGAVTDPAAARIARGTEVFQENVLRPLRHARDGVKPWMEGRHSETATALRREMLRGELAVERFEQGLVLDMLNQPQSLNVPEDPLADASRSVARYLAALGVRPDCGQMQSLALIITTALEDYDGLHVSRVLSRALKDRADTL